MSQQYHKAHLKQRERRLDSASSLCEHLSRVGIAPESIVDFGSGFGFFLISAKTHWKDCKILGLDGSWLPRDEVLVGPAEFQHHDLQKSVKLDKRFDLAVSLEVAEHLLEEFSETFVKSLTEASDLVLFSAAIPNQGGQGHKNEQYGSYWAGLFAKCGYSPVDILHPLIWGDSRMLFWLRQNVILYANPGALNLYPHFRRHIVAPELLNRIHPEMFKNALRLSKKTAT